MLSDPEFERVPVAEWDSLVDHLRRFAADGEFNEADDRAVVTVGDARFSVTREGHVETEMVLHEFEDEHVGALYFDHEGGRVRVDGGGTTYEFRRPS
ncbi:MULTISPECIES: hypothetical protein [Halorussus]|uniref:hypothetical protein n=1 Tax=Halorussus TaxID=1070314 RepID=UPI00209DEAD3|nr:hypothetical protein [Halorussus vallis]USZ74527.1 hypothetical protein NGM07_13870 [Halorussus vallis]